TRLWMPPDSSLYSLQGVAAVTLPFAPAFLRFEFSAPSYRLEQETMFQSRLDGYDERWSAWTKEPFREYTRIPEGNYTMRVRAKTIDGVPGKEAAYAFTVLPPWYRTWPVYGVYLLLAGGGVYGLVRWRSRQLEAEKQELEKEVAQRTTEIARTNAQLAQTNEKLAEQSAQVAAKNAQLETQAQLLAAQAEALEAQTRKLQELDGVKSRFFANISHEFRTPLTLILGNLQDKLGLPRQAEGEAVPVPAKELGVMQRNAKRLLELINQLLDLSKLESGQLHLDPRPAELTGFLRVLAASFASLADYRQIGFEVRLPGEPLHLHFDADKLEKILYNLLANAFKFTPDAGRVALHAAKLPSGDGPLCLVRLSVYNTGPGIAADQLDKVFDRFYQGARHYADGQGTGIGLALVKELVQLHGGRVHVESDAVRGTWFVVELPLPLASPQEAAGAEAAPPAGEPVTPPPTGALPVAARVPESEAVAAAGAVPAENAALPLLLLVEDNADLRAYIGRHLEDQYRVLESENGRLGLEVALAQLPDLIVTDLMMPEMDGLALCQTLKSDPRTSHIPVVMLTALATQQSKLRGLETGADEYLTKPFDAQELRLRVRNLVESRRRLREKFARQVTIAPKDIAVSSLDEKLLEKLLKAVEDHMHNPEFGPEELAGEMAMSRMQLHRKITALTGKTTTDFLRSMRLKRAAQLLEARAGNVSDIAYQVGMDNLTYFSRCFKEQFGVPASEYAAHQATLSATP
ncbi:MAG TPA: ATP-binding protein, partial [Cytophagales bacterium]